MSRKVYLSHLAYYLVLALQQMSPVYGPMDGCAGVMADGRETLEEWTCGCRIVFTDLRLMLCFNYLEHF